jgi:predicted nucleotidyltransferase
MEIRDSKLTDIERSAVEDLKQRLEQVLGKNLIKVVLYGSKARGDPHRDSDIDILVFVHTYNAAVHEQVYDIDWEVFCANDFAVPISVQVIDEEEWQKYEQCGSAFYWNVSGEGIAV